MAINTLGAISEVAISAVSYIFKDSERERKILAQTLESKLSFLEDAGGFWGRIAKFAKQLLPQREERQSEVDSRNKKQSQGEPKLAETEMTMENAKIEVQKNLEEACNYFQIKTNNTVPIMMAICQLESGFNPKSLNRKSGATGLFQFTGKTKESYRAWAENSGLFPDLKTTRDDANSLSGMFNPKLNTFAGLKLLAENAKALNIDLNKEMTDQELQDAAIKLYAAHNSGSGNVRAITEALKGDYAIMNQQSSKYPWLKGREKYIAKAGNLALDYKNYV
jgi:hypothetical protein